MIFECSQSTEWASALEAAAAAVASGGLIVVPTDTVYGIAADAFNRYAIEALNSVRGRRKEVMPPVAVGSLEAIDGLMNSVPESVRELTRAFWPGALTLVVEHAPSLPWSRSETKGHVQVRMPRHDVAIELLRKTGPLVLISALPLPGCRDSARSVFDVLGDTVEVYLDAGEIPFVPFTRSTILSCTSTQPIVLRKGGVSVGQIERVLGRAVIVGDASGKGL